MPKMIVSMDGVLMKEVQLTQDKTTVGRRPYNDIVIDNLAVSGEHAVLHRVGPDVFLEDLNSTNGTHVNGQVIKRQLLRSGDDIGIGKCKIQFVGGEDSGAEVLRAAVKVLSGAALGKEMPLTKAVTRIGKPGIAVAAITKRHDGFVVHHAEGGSNPTLNGATIGPDPVALKSGDVIELAGTQMQFVQT